MVGVLCALAGAGLAIGVAVERHASFKLAQENTALQQQLSPMDKLIAENLRLSNLVAQAKGSPLGSKQRVEATSATEERAKELVRLRQEVAALRQQSKEIESLREDTRQARAARENSLKSQNAGPVGKDRQRTRHEWIAIGDSSSAVWDGQYEHGRDGRAQREDSR